MENKMKYENTAYYKKDEDRIEAVSEDILIEFPKLGYLSKKAAQMETPFGNPNQDYERISQYENQINRLINIIIITENNQEYLNEYDKAVNDMIEAYQNWKTNYTYANPESTPTYLVFQTFKTHIMNPIIPLLTLDQATSLQKRKKYNENIRRKAELLRKEYPFLGPIAEQEIQYELDSGVWLKYQENDLIQLVNILKLIDKNEEYKDIYIKVLEELTKKYKEWIKNELNKNSSEVNNNIIDMMERIETHLDNEQSPIYTYYDIITEKRKNEKIY